MHFLSKLKNLNSQDLLLLVKAVYWTGIASILILVVPLKRFSFLLGKHMQEAPQSPVSVNHALLHSIQLAINRTCRLVPWRCKCYEQAIAAKMILRGYGLPSTFYYGVAIDHEKKLIAHAWVQCGDFVVTGRKGMKRFTVVGSFA